MFGPGVTSLSVTLPLIADDTFEITEILQASLSFPGAPPPLVRIYPDLANIAILDDDGEFVKLFGHSFVIWHFQNCCLDLTTMHM